MTENSKYCWGCRAHETADGNVKWYKPFVKQFDNILQSQTYVHLSLVFIEEKRKQMSTQRLLKEFSSNYYS